MKEKQVYKIKENSLLARIVRVQMKSSNVAMVIGNKIHLSGVTKEHFLNDKKWLRHEMVHIEQFQRYGFFRFLFLYLAEWVRKGYYNNKFEVEARNRAGESGD